MEKWRPKYETASGVQNEQQRVVRARTLLPALIPEPNVAVTRSRLSRFCFDFVSVCSYGILDGQRLLWTWIWLPQSLWMKGRSLHQRRTPQQASYKKTSNSSRRRSSSSSSTSPIYNHHTSTAATPPQRKSQDKEGEERRRLPRSARAGGLVLSPSPPPCLSPFPPPCWLVTHP